MADLEASALFSVKGRVALVTGGSSGIGMMISKVIPANSCVIRELIKHSHLFAMEQRCML